MKLANILALTILASVAIAQPTVERTSPTQITVTGDYAFVEGSPLLVIQNGTGMYFNSVAWAVDGTIIYEVLPHQEYTVNAFTFDQATPDEREILTVTIPALPVDDMTLDDYMYELVRAQRVVTTMSNAGEITYFDITAAMQRAAVRLDAESSSTDP